MAIIRIKRTTSDTLPGGPTGLTFGELAFIGASGGATANRLYIAGPQGTCIWIGAQILNQPTYWSGATAETTIPTVSAVDSRIGSRISSESVTAIGSTSNASWQKLAVSFTDSNKVSGATGFVNILGATWEDNTTTNAGNVGGIANGSNLQGKTVFEILYNMLYSYQTVSLSSVSMSGTFTTGNVELGQTAAVGGSRNFGWTATQPQNINDNGITVVYSGTNTGTIIGATAYSNNGGAPGGNANRAGTIPDARFTNIGNNFTITVNASQSTAYANAGSPGTTTGATASRSIGTSTWYSKMYWGYTSGSSITSRSQLVTTGMGTSERFITTTSTTYLFNSTSGTGVSLGFTPSQAPGGELQYLYVLIHNYYNTIPTWKDSGGFAFGMTGNNNTTIGSTLDIQNAQGFTASYKIYRSAEQTDATSVYIYSDA
jgi:hypothetical protein